MEMWGNYRGKIEKMEGKGTCIQVTARQGEKMMNSGEKLCKIDKK